MRCLYSARVAEETHCLSCVSAGVLAGGIFSVFVATVVSAVSKLCLRGRRNCLGRNCRLRSFAQLEQFEKQYAHERDMQNCKNTINSSLFIFQT